MGEYLTTAEVAERYRQPESTIRYWRMISYGPVGVKIGKRVLYRLADVERFDSAIADGTVTKAPEPTPLDAVVAKIYAERDDWKERAGEWKRRALVAEKALRQVRRALDSASVAASDTTEGTTP